jgi:tetratricopeptide (TPR) repeat protein
VGKIHLEHGRYEAARAEIEAALGINPDFVELWLYLGFVLIDLRQFDAARAAFEEAAHRGADGAEVHYLLGFCFELDDDPGRAYLQYRLAVRRSPANPSFLTALANLCDRSGRHEEAFRTFQAVMAIDTLSSTALNYVGYTLADRAESLDYSLQLVERALAIEPDNGYIIDSRGWVYYRLGRFAEALAELERALSYLEDAVILEHLGDVYLALDERGRALAAYERALGLDPRNRKLRKKIVALRTSAGQ